MTSIWLQIPNFCHWKTLWLCFFAFFSVLCKALHHSLQIWVIYFSIFFLQINCQSQLIKRKLNRLKHVVPLFSFVSWKWTLVSEYQWKSLETCGIYCSKRSQRNFIISKFISWFFSENLKLGLLCMVLIPLYIRNLESRIIWQGSCNCSEWLVKKGPENIVNLIPQHLQKGKTIS